MAEYRKKPIVIDAFQMTNAAFHNDGGSEGEWPQWAQDACEAGTIGMHGPDGIACRIKTLEGVMDCAFDDFVIRGVKGEIYPCKPDIFAATYEPV